MAKIGLFRLFINFLILGCTSFGGPIAHLGYFRERFVSRLKILDEAHYLQLVSFCQLLPVPTSSQVSMLIGFTTNGLVGAIVAFVLLQYWKVPMWLLVIAGVIAGQVLT